MRLRALLAGAGLPAPQQDVEIQGISYDTRTIRPGELYVALRGYKTDGHRYITQARQKGAAAIVAEEGENCILVPDSRSALAVLAREWFGHPEQGLTLVGVTGTNGKTTTTSLLSHILTRTLGTKVGLLGTNEVRIGEESFPAQRTTPESYEVWQWLRKMADGGCTHVVMEVSSHALCLHRVEGVPFDVGAFTNLTRDHLDFHGTMEAYKKAKKRLFFQSKLAVLNLDDRTGREYDSHCPCPVLGYSATGDADLTADHVHLLPDRVEFDAVAGEEHSPVVLHIPGAFSVSNALCALGCAIALGVPLADAGAALATAHGVKGRMEVVPHRGPGTVIIDYAHTPDALEKVLLALRPNTVGRLICLFGCGGDRDRTKRPIMGAVAARLSDVCIVTSDNPRTEDPAAIIGAILAGMERWEADVIVEPDRRLAIRAGLQMLREGDTLLLAGKGHETYQEIGGVKYPLDEREEVAKY